MDFPKTVEEHRTNVGRLRCVITDRPNPTLHHAQGGSIRRRLSEMGYDPSKSLNQRGSASEALIIPLAAELHSAGKDGIDGQIGRMSWEDRYGEQARYVDEVGELLGYSLWDLFILWSPRKRLTLRNDGSRGPGPSGSGSMPAA